MKNLFHVFENKADPVTIDRDEFQERLGLRKSAFHSTPLRHPELIRYVSRSFLNFKRDAIGPCETYYAHPEREHTSAAISFTTEAVSIDKINFALTITGDSTGMNKRENAMIFGIFGYYSPEKPMTVTKIIAPIKDDRNSLGKSLEIGVSDETLQRAMIFAEHCAKSLYETGKINVRACFDLADKAALKQSAATPKP